MDLLEHAIRNRRSSEKHFDQTASPEDDRFQAVVLDFGGRYLVFDKSPWFGTDIHCIACDDYMTELMDDRADWETDVEETPDGAYGLDCEVRWLAHPANTMTIRVVREGDQ